MEGHILISVIVIVGAMFSIPALGLSSPVTGTYLTDSFGFSSSVSIGENSSLSINKIRNISLGGTFIVEVKNETVGVDMYGMTDTFRIESDDIVFVYNKSVMVSIQNKTVDFREGPLRIGKIYELSERQKRRITQMEI